MSDSAPAKIAGELHERAKFVKLENTTYLPLCFFLMFFRIQMYSTYTATVYVYGFRSNMTEIDRNIQDGGQNHEDILILSCTY